jgi:hypothetical protein
MLFLPSSHSFLSSFLLLVPRERGETELYEGREKLEQLVKLLDGAKRKKREGGGGLAIHDFTWHTC